MILMGLCGGKRNESKLEIEIAQRDGNHGKKCIFVIKKVRKKMLQDWETCPTRQKSS